MIHGLNYAREMVVVPATPESVDAKIVFSAIAQ